MTYMSFWKFFMVHGHCIGCGQCTKACPMSIDVMAEVKNGKIDSNDCILCGQGVNSYPRNVLSIKLRQYCQHNN